MTRAGAADITTAAGPPTPEYPLNTSCPECSSPVPVPDDVLEGELIVCEHCGVELELVTRSPLAVEVFEEEEK